MRMHGKVVKWLDDKGYGFILTEQGQEIFLHISNFKSTAFIPRVGEEVNFTIAKDWHDRTQATDVVFLNQLISLKKQRHVFSTNRNNFLFSCLFVCLILGLVLVFVNRHLAQMQVDSKPLPEITQSQKVQEKINPPLSGVISNKPRDIKLNKAENLNSNQMVYENQPLPEMPPLKLKQSTMQSFQCEGKTRCTQMRSCEEAIFYLRNCPGSVMDGDGDGLPCEDQWCNQ